jgi:hypothetical protein
MPKKFDDMVNAIKNSLKKEYPNLTDKELENKAYAMAVSQWKKMHNGKMPTEELKDWRVLEFYVPIEEKIQDDNDFIIRGVAINETTTLNNVKYVAEELIKAASTFRNVPILLDHKNEVKNIVGRTTERVEWNPIMRRIDFEAKIMDKDIKEMIRDGRIGSVSIGAKVNDLIEESDGSMKAIGIRGLEISLVAVPGDGQANLAQALQHNYRLKEISMYDEEDEEIELDTIDENDNEINQKEEKMAEGVNENIKEISKEETKTVVESSNKSEFEEMRKQIADLKELLIAKKELKEEIKGDKTVGLVSNEKIEELDRLDNYIIERAEKGFALYRDYTKENSNTKLKRLIKR